ncbi:hypothetical protein LIER_24435 [Lithospermum erythrorhizon]|uniref:RING-type E3 ubiquitin transferase n=1 Tax=Lithospermum erythrorhizon TaxID=34254 RepID=A0AAV3R6W7_LITER
MSSGTSRRMHVPPHQLYNQNSRQGVVDSRQPYSYQDRIMQLPFPSTRVPSPSYYPVRVLMLDNESSTILPTPNSRPRAPASFGNEPTRDVSKLTQEEQQNALSKLRKEMYNPVMLSRSTTKPNYPSKDWELLSHKTKKNEDGQILSCAICLEDFEVQEFVTSTPCNHMFHSDCIVPWVKAQGRCPICRFAII